MPGLAMGTNECEESMRVFPYQTLVEQSEVDVEIKMEINRE